MVLVENSDLSSMKNLCYLNELKIQTIPTDATQLLKFCIHLMLQSYFDDSFTLFHKIRIHHTITK